MVSNPMGRRWILCYGDSLTAGFCDFGHGFEPYGKTLAENLPSCVVTACGLSGWTAKEMIMEKNSSNCCDVAGNVGKGLSLILSESLPELALILVGTNDLGFATCQTDLTAERILNRVKYLHSLCHRRGVATVAFTPPTLLSGPCRRMQRQLNRLIADWASSTSMVLAHWDVEELVPRTSGQLWDADEIHMSADGQRTLGHRLSTLLPNLSSRQLGSEDSNLQHPCPALQAKRLPAKAMVRNASSPSTSPEMRAVTVSPKCCQQFSSGICTTGQFAGLITRPYTPPQQQTFTTSVFPVMLMVR